jgi:hypothetical protein
MINLNKWNELHKNYQTILTSASGYATLQAIGGTMREIPCHTE